MRVNKKTQLLCMSSSLISDVTSFIDTEDNEKIVAGETLKILGFVFGTRPNVQEHVRSVIKKFNARSWTIWNLKKVGLPTNDLLKIYFSLVRPVIEYAASAYHSLLTNEQSEEIERLQKRILKVIYGWTYSYDTILTTQKIPSLKERRQELVTNFAQKSSKNPRFSSWFKKRAETPYNTRRRLEYEPTPLVTERDRKNPLTYMKDLLNRLN